MANTAATAMPSSPPLTWLANRLKSEEERASEGGKERERDGGRAWRASRRLTCVAFCGSPRRGRRRGRGNDFNSLVLMSFM